MNTETPIMREIRATLVRTGRVMLWRNNTGKIHGTLTNPGRAPRRVDVDFGIGLGGADLVGMLRGSGRFFAIEVKTPEGRLAPDQKLWRDAVRMAGGFYAVATSPAEALAALALAEAGAATHTTREIDP